MEGEGDKGAGVRGRGKRTSGTRAAPGGEKRAADAPGRGLAYLKVGAEGGGDLAGRGLVRGLESVGGHDGACTVKEQDTVSAVPLDNTAAQNKRGRNAY